MVAAPFPAVPRWLAHSAVTLGDAVIYGCALGTPTRAMSLSKGSAATAIHIVITQDAHVFLLQDDIRQAGTARSISRRQSGSGRCVAQTCERTFPAASNANATRCQEATDELRKAELLRHRETDRSVRRHPSPHAATPKPFLLPLCVTSRTWLRAGDGAASSCINIITV